MSELYTPSVDAVRQRYAYDRVDYSGSSVSHLEAEDEFDRWLAQHNAELREQIVADLKAAHKQSVDAGYAWGHTFEDGLAEAAMIVKGVL